MILSDRKEFSVGYSPFCKCNYSASPFLKFVVIVFWKLIDFRLSMTQKREKRSDRLHYAKSMGSKNLVMHCISVGDSRLMLAANWPI